MILPYILVAIGIVLCVVGVVGAYLASRSYHND
jgi:hypothetical protein